ncbi:DUF4089 domain-containing protein [Planktothrix mougeotii]|uniref:DUF4089 domain-containing protein n=1 Tax=Planktothrix mougeotii TaxID=54306 RepID=UPI002AD522EB|nr:DUF4089 domain-containing protein [Planktothrix mougeotii]
MRKRSARTHILLKSIKIIKNIEESINQIAQLINLPLPPQYHQSVIANLERIAAIASRINNFS